MFKQTGQALVLFSAPPPIYPDLAGKVALVTGSMRGSGALICRLLALNGAKVIVNDSCQAAIDRVIEDIWDEGGRAMGVAADITNRAEIERLRLTVERDYGAVGVLVVATDDLALSRPAVQSSETQPHISRYAALATTVLTVRSFLPRMIERRCGSIIIVPSPLWPGQGSAAYTLTRAASGRFTRQVAREVAAQGVRINCAVSRSPNLHGVAEAVALAALFLASNSSAWITGSTLDVADGRLNV